MSMYWTRNFKANVVRNRDQTVRQENVSVRMVIYLNGWGQLFLADEPGHALSPEEVQDFTDTGSIKIGWMTVIDISPHNSKEKS